MRFTRLSALALASGLALLASSVARADDPIPEPPRPPSPEEGPVDQAGTGGTVAYAEGGVIESGGNLGLSFGGDYLAFQADPMIGYFLWNNIEASAILGVQHVSTDGSDQTRMSLVIEPSFHYPFTDKFFGFLGFGIGAAMVNPALVGPDGEEVGFGSALAPRIGAQFLVGRSGLLNVGARQVLTFVDVDSDSTAYGGEALLAFSNMFQLQTGYTVMF